MGDARERALAKIREAKEKRLTELDLINRAKKYKLTEIPPEVFELEWLEKLYLRRNQLTEIPETITRLSHLSVLDVSDNQLTKIPETITRITNLSKLNLSDNQLTEIPKTITRLSHLSALDVSDNKLTEIPETITRLNNLSQLYLRRNQLTKIPETITRLNNLSRLDLRRNQLTEIPEAITRLSNLSVLDLSGNQLTEIPESITRLSNLSVLDLSGNQLTEIPESITRLSNLSMLDLSGNQLTEIPEAITRLSNLSLLYLNRNQLKEIPEAITRLSNLSVLALGDNPLETPPREVAERGIRAIREYFRQLREEGEESLYEAKMLIVGEAGAGKTTLAKKIDNPDYQLQSQEASTEGIDVLRWSFPHQEQTFYVNIWDFGGQEIYHATHQFFLTKRSLYILVADSRKEDTDFYYWMNVVYYLSDNSPLLVVKNEKQDRQREINERTLRGQFTNFKETLPSNLATNRGWDEIINAIQHHITKLPHVGDKLPKTWKQVRQVLEQDSRHYISLEKYLEICQENGFQNREDALQLSQYLHDLGICLHFQNDDLLGKTVILKPEWATDAVYRVLDSEKVRKNSGYFTFSNLQEIWHEEKYANMWGELLRLMMMFQLCYEIPSKPKHYIAPQLLSENQPDYPWNKTDNRILRYTYPEFMPKGIVTRFIVAMHSYIYQQKYVWRSGVILQNHDKDTKAEVIEHYDKREINIRLVGKQKRELMTVIDHEFQKIHDSYSRLNYQQLIPCNCDTCQNSQSPHFYRLHILRKFISDAQEHIQCQNSYQMVDVRDLIGDVFGSQEESRNFAKDAQPSQQSINIINNVDNTNQAMSQDRGDINQSGNFGVGVNQGEIKDNAKAAGIYNEAEQQNLVQAAAEIQQLLEQLEQTYPTDTLSGKMQIATKATEKIENNAPLKQRILQALKAGEIFAIEEALNHPASSFVINALKDWQQSKPSN
jgi:Leucine-rich repeat (LRR) protein